MRTECELSVVIPAFNEKEGLRVSVAEIISRADAAVDGDFEIVLVDDGSTDGTPDLIQQLAKEESRVVPLILARNFGKESAMQAGLDAARGRAIILMDADLQHPPDVISQMVDLWKRQGYEVVNAVKAERKDKGIIYQVLTAGFNKLMSGAIRKDFQGASDFKLLDRQVVDCLNACPERVRFFRGLVAWVGFKETNIEFAVTKREIGESKWSTMDLMRYTIRNLIAFSSVPLQFVSVFGFLTAFIGLLMGLHTLYNYAIGVAVSGFTTVIVLMTFLSGAVLACLGIIALYLAMLFEEQKQRPIYVVRRPVTTSK